MADLPTGASVAAGALALALAAALATALGACVSDPPTITPVEPTRDLRARVTPEADTAAFRVDPTNSELGIGFERFAFRLFNATGGEITDGEVTVAFYTVNEALRETIRKASGEALYFGSEIPGGGRWVVYTEFDVSGPWAVDVTAELPGGTTGLATANVLVEGRPDVPNAGRPVPMGDTPSLADGPLSELTTDPDPDDALYGQTVDEAVATGLPTVVLFASPGHCPDEGCAATLDALRRVAVQYGGRVNFVHVESRDPDSPEQLSEAARAWGLTTDPWAFFVDRRGFVWARIEGPVGRDELTLMVDRMLAEG